jgi:ADP-sugar diphosphatase
MDHFYLHFNSLIILTMLNLARSSNKLFGYFNHTRFHSFSSSLLTKRTNSRLTAESPVLIMRSVLNKNVLITSQTLDFKTLNLAIESKPMKEWLTRMDTLQKQNHLKLHHVNVQSVDMFGNKVGFVKFVADVTDKDGDKCPGSVFMRGGSVAVLPILKTNFQKYVILVQMLSVPTASYDLPSLPAGMMDDTGTFAGNMAREIYEETSIAIHESELLDMTEKVYGEKFQGVYLSSGGTDEYVRLFCFERDVSREYVDTLRNKITGLTKENEKIKLTVVPLEKLCSYTSDTKALSAKALYDYLFNTYC